jgi:outer membrane protein OmpA-like peptidoglycan-associated protein/YHS domain-containing protein
MKKITILLFIVLTSISLTAQNKDTKSGDKLFDRYEYASAAKEYLSLLENANSDPYVYKQLGDCFYNMANTVEAEKWYSKAVESKQDLETYYNYAQVLKSNGKYVESDKQMSVFADMAPNDTRAIAFNSNPNYLVKLKNIDKLFDINRLSVNSEKSSFGASLNGKSLYFASARNNGSKIYGWNNEPFLDLYQSNYNVSDGTYSEPTAISELNTVYHEGPLTMTKDGNTIYFSSESFKDKLFVKDNSKKLKFGQVSLYKAVKNDGKWSAIIPLPFNSKNYSTGNPSIDKEGKTLYFASNMPGSIGGTDIWKVLVNSDDTFGAPENLGDKINTVGDENFPFISDDDILYYSSNGLIGLGGLDVFYVDLNKNETPNNMGSPVNTEKDDFSFTFNKEKNIGYLSSNRSGVDNIYNAIPVCKSEMLAIVKDSKTNALLANSRVVFLDADKNVLETKITNENGEASYATDCQKQFSMDVYKDGYFTKSFPTTTKQGKISIEAAIVPIDVIVTETEIVVNPIYFYSDKNDITDRGASELDKLIYVMSQNNAIRIDVKSHTDSRGTDEYNLDLSDRRAKSTVAYIISKGISAERITGKGYGEAAPKIDCHDKCTELEYALNRRSEFMIVK